MGANIAGIYGAQIFRQDDRPRYRRGFSIGIAVLALGVVLAIIRYIDDRLRRRRADQGAKAWKQLVLNARDSVINRLGLTR